MIKKKKIVVASFLVVFLMGAFVLTASAVSSKFDCSYSGVSCKGVNVISYGTALTHSDYVSAKSGQVLSVSNRSDGPFNLITQLVDSSGNAISKEIAFTDTQFIRVPKNDNYRIKVMCKDTSSKERCTGETRVSQ